MPRRAVLALILCLAACNRPAPAPGISQVVLATDDKSPRILRGIFPGEGGWRYTATTFALSLDRPAAGKPAYLELDLDVPEELNSAVTVVAKVNGSEVARKSLNKGRQFLAAPVPEAALGRQPAEVEIAADRSFRDGASGSQLSLILFSAGLKEFEQTAEFRDSELAKSRQAYDEVLKQRDLKVPIEKQKEIMRLFHELPVWDSMWFQNVRIIKNPMDLWMLQQTAYETRPDFIIETGTWQGGSALWWAQTLTGMGLDQARVITVDIQDLTKVASAHPLWKKHVDFLLGSSTDPKIVQKIAERVKGRRVLVNLDSDHSMSARVQRAAGVHADARARRLHRRRGHPSGRHPDTPGAWPGPDGGRPAAFSPEPEGEGLRAGFHPRSADHDVLPRRLAPPEEVALIPRAAKKDTSIRTGSAAARPRRRDHAEARRPERRAGIRELGVVHRIVELGAECQFGALRGFLLPSMRLPTEKSAFTWPGPLRMLWPALPYPADRPTRRGGRADGRGVDPAIQARRRAARRRQRCVSRRRDTS